jgi:hypothetical protein
MLSQLAGRRFLLLAEVLEQDRKDDEEPSDDDEEEILVQEVCDGLDLELELGHGERIVYVTS